MRFFQLPENGRKVWNLGYFMKMGDNHEIFPNFKKIGKKHEILLFSWERAKIMKFSQLHENGRKSWNLFLTSRKWGKSMKFCLLHGNGQKSWNLANFMKVGETHEIVTNSRKLANPKFFWDIHDNECPRKFWEIHDNEYPRKLKITHVLRICHLPKKYTKIVRFYELRKNERKSWDFANFRKMGENHEILSTSWK